MNKSLKKVPVVPKKENGQFNFNLQRMKKAVEAPSYVLPKDLTFAGFESWIQNHQPKE